MFREEKEALEWLYVQKKQKRREDLSRIEACIQELGIKTKYKIIHIAGTNGKGSTASFLRQMLMAKGNKVGLFVSPYVLCFEERIQMNTTFIPKEVVVKYCNQLYEFAKAYTERTQDTIPFFELTFLMALLYFQEQNIDVAVIECGLGGLLDSTNVLHTDVSIITNIGYDHMQQLGNTLEEIAVHKLGITRRNRPCFTAVSLQLQPLFKEYASAHQVDMHFILDEVQNISFKEGTLSFTFRGILYHTMLNAKYQAYNASLAIAVILYLYPEYEKSLLCSALESAFWPGRFELIYPNVVLDGAHNLDGIEALVESLRLEFKEKRIKVVFTALHDKAISQMVEKLDELAVSYYFTSLQDTRATSVDYFKRWTKKPYELFEAYQEALDKAIGELKEDELLVVTGSLHFISVARFYLLEKKERMD